MCPPPARTSSDVRFVASRPLRPAYSKLTKGSESILFTYWTWSGKMTVSSLLSTFFPASRLTIPFDVLYPVTTSAFGRNMQSTVRLSHQGTSVASSSPDLIAIFWRYRWVVIWPAIVGAIAGYAVFARTPLSYQSTTRLLVESDHPAVLDAMTGDFLGGVPTLEIIESQLFSDQVGKMAFDSELLERFHPRFSGSAMEFVALSQESLKLESKLTDMRSAQSFVAMMHFKDRDPELCRAAVQAYFIALQQFFNDRQKSSRGELIRLITVATERLHPKMLELENRYREFRVDAPLAWDSNGEAINPHRERQLFLIQRRSELIERQRQLEVELASIESIVARASKDPLLALNIIGQLLDRRFTLPTTLETRVNLREGDNQLKQIEVDQQLVPLMIERNKYEAQFGANHPTVAALDSELNTMKNELKRLVEQETSRIVELMAKEGNDAIDPITRAQEAVTSLVFASKSQLDLLEKQINRIDLQIEEEKLNASKIAQVEQENQSQLREIERTRELMNQLEEQMARVSLSEEEGGTRVVELTAPSSAYPVGPSLARSFGMGTFLGLAVGMGLALLLEKNANTFRDQDEVAEILGVPVLTHVPHFKGNLFKNQQSAANPFEELDPLLAVVHMPHSVPAEAIRSCRTSIYFETLGPGGKIIQVTSPLPGDGKSTIAGNLACSIAQSGKRVLAIDCDLRRPQLTDNFAMRKSLGLSNVLNTECDPIDAIHETPLENLWIMPSGPIPVNPAEALAMPQMSSLLEMLREKYDYIVVDTPPLLVVSDPSITASMVDGVVLTLRIRRKSKPNALESVSILRTVDAKILGVVINNSDAAALSDGYRGYGYYRHSRYTHRYAHRYQQSLGSSVDHFTETNSSSMRIASRTARKVPSSRTEAIRSKQVCDED